MWPAHARSVGPPLRIRHTGLTLNVQIGMEASESNQELNEAGDERHRQARLLRAASHDIRGPLANVRSYASLLADPRMELSDKARRSIEVIIRNADKALLLLREFIDSEQAERGILDLPTQAVALRPVLDKALRPLTSLVEEKKLTLHVDDRVQASVEAEPSALEHILRVLVEHAIDRSAEGATVRVQTFDGEDGRLGVRVVDHGVPLSTDEQASLFDREAHLARRAKLTLGFRLSLAATEAGLMGGRLRVQSDADQTALELRLPATPT